MYELIELTDCELDAVSGGNPFSINLSGISASFSSTISLRLSTAFTNAPALMQTNTSDQSVTITGDGAG
jgi:bacteriocin-like protein